MYIKEQDMVKKLISFAENDVKELEKLAKEKGISLSELVRRILDRYLEERKTKKSKVG
jgi:metal-responsive CopG/Arc/MetJ family transcriptional regulator